MNCTLLYHSYMKIRVRKTVEQLWRGILDLIFPRNIWQKEFDSLHTNDIYQLRPKSIDEYTWIHSLFDYKDTCIRESIHTLKYNGNKSVAQKYGVLLHDYLIHILEDTITFEFSRTPPSFLLVPVPLHTHKKRDRGFNQAELLVNEILKCDTTQLLFHIPNSIIKTRETPAQSSLSSKQKRMQNLQNCFSVPQPHILQDQYVILIDDLYTTGTTLERIRALCFQAGARKVLAFTIAH